jgi:hypothetical protein
MDSKLDNSETVPKRPWEPMQLTYVGHTATVMTSKPGLKTDGSNTIHKT